jgi:hypothetical protein
MALCIGANVNTTEGEGYRKVRAGSLEYTGGTVCEIR